jgi:hypothetical protein
VPRESARRRNWGAPESGPYNLGRCGNHLARGTDAPSGNASVGPDPDNYTDCGHNSGCQPRLSYHQYLPTRTKSRNGDQGNQISSAAHLAVQSGWRLRIKPRFKGRFPTAIRSCMRLDPDMLLCRQPPRAGSVPQPTDGPRGVGRSKRMNPTLTTLPDVGNIPPAATSTSPALALEAFLPSLELAAAGIDRTGDLKHAGTSAHMAYGTPAEDPGFLSIPQSAQNPPVSTPGAEHGRTSRHSAKKWGTNQWLPERCQITNAFWRCGCQRIQPRWTCVRLVRRPGPS